MELVRGVKITDFCDEQKLSAEERLKLFIQVCQAIQHAHQKGIIHRDIKPSNILVTINDGVPVPKVIDFGIAKAMEGRLTDHTLFTAFEQFLGTPAYMSPEQAVMTSLDIDTRSDIYSLGVLLYELLTGKTPFEQKELLSAGLEEMRRTIREREPPKPSTRLSAMLKEELTTTAQRRRTEPPKLIHTVRGDLDWIVMKSLEKERARRYETASSLAMDVQRYLTEEPVLARPPSKVYQFKKMVRRHKMGFAAAGAVLAALLAGLGLSTYLFFCEKQEKERATAAQITAQVEAEKSQQVAQFLEEMLEGVGPEVAQGRDTALMRAILDKTQARIALELKAQPEVAATLYSTLGGVYDQLDDYATAEAMCRTAIQLQQSVSGKDDESVAQLIHHLGLVQGQRGDLTGAESTFRQALALEDKLMGQENPETVETMAGLAQILKQRGDLPGAENLLRDALMRTTKLPGPQQTEMAFLHNELGLVLWSRGDLSGAEASLTESLSLRKSAFGEMNPEVAIALGNIGLVRWERGNLPGAEQAQRQALAIRKKLFGAEHTQVANSLNNLALVLRDEGDLAGAEAAQRQSLAIETKLAGPDHPNTASARDNLATILRRRGALAGDAGLFRQALQLNPTDPLTADGFAALLAIPFLTPVSSSPATPGIWRFTSVSPPSDWASPDFSDTGWQSAPALSGRTNYVPHSERAITPRTNLWLRTSFELSRMPSAKLVCRLNRNQDAQVFLNGVPVAPVADWSDTEVLLSCSAAAQAALHPGRNVLAMHCEVADGGAPVGASLYMMPDPNRGWAGLIEEFDRAITNQPQRAELYVGRAGALVRCGRMADAVKDLAKATVLKPTSDTAWYGFGTVLVSMNQQSSYQNARREILQRFAQPPSPQVAERMARIVMLTQIDASELHPAADWADHAASADYADANLSRRQLTESLALYRRGQFADAIEWSDKLLASAANPAQPGWTHEQVRNQKAAAWFLEAMAWQKLQEPDKARDAFGKGMEVVDTELPAFDGGDPGRDWPDRLIVHILQQETKATLR
ncbi:MAG TPA: tetratricopeptide repeat protein, partial [Candidatus Acidoferrales bacterium]|nr:tetratricopeptide repeat protein [Candidatus Acidoferrales bacterium]